MAWLGGMKIIFNPRVIDYLDALPDPLPTEVYDSIAYFEQFGVAAQLPDVAPIASLPGTWETRNQATVAGRRYTIRVLLRVDDDNRTLPTRPLLETRTVS